MSTVGTNVDIPYNHPPPPPTPNTHIPPQPPTALSIPLLTLVPPVDISPPISNIFVTISLLHLVDVSPSDLIPSFVCYL